MTASAPAAAWSSCYAEGCKYLRSAHGGITRPHIFTPQITFNLAAMAIEKLSMALLLEAGDIADNHTMHDLVISLSRLPDFDLNLLQAIHDLGRFEDLCSMGPPRHDLVSASDIPAILDVAKQLLATAQERLPLAPAE